MSDSAAAVAISRDPGGWTPSHGSARNLRTTTSSSAGSDADRADTSAGAPARRLRAATPLSPRTFPPERATVYALDGGDRTPGRGCRPRKGPRCGAASTSATSSSPARLSAQSAMVNGSGRIPLDFTRARRVPGDDREIGGGESRAAASTCGSRSGSRAGARARGRSPAQSVRDGEPVDVSAEMWAPRRECALRAIRRRRQSPP